MISINARALAQEVVSHYFSNFNPYERNSVNVEQCLRRPITAITINILTDAKGQIHAPKTASEDVPDSAVINHKQEAQEEEKKGEGGPNRGAASPAWTDPLAMNHRIEEADLLEADVDRYETLHRRSKARLEAFLQGVKLAVASGPSTLTPKNKASAQTSEFVVSQQTQDISLADGLKGFLGKDKDSAAPFFGSLNGSGQKLLRSISAGQPAKKEKKEQVEETDLMTRVELYVRCLCRVKGQGQECVLAAEPTRVLRARAKVVVAAFVGTVSTVRQQSTILNRLLVALTKELLAVEFLSPDLMKTIRRLVTDYEQQTSFASLAFLSTPDDSADTRLTPMILKYLKFLQNDWKNHTMDCELERMLTLALDPDMRKTFKTVEFQSIGHLLETCADYRSQLQKIELAPGIVGEADYQKIIENPDAVRQAIRDLQRERITVNGNLLPPVTSRKELIYLLQQTMNSRTLTAVPLKPRRTGRRSRRNATSTDEEPSEGSESSEFTSSAAESDAQNADGPSRDRKPHSRNFHVSTIDVLTKRLLVAASRTGTGGDAYFVVRDLFGGDDVEVIPSDMLPTHGRAVRPGTIEILVRLASVTIKCHGSFDVYPKSMVRACEPLIQLHTTTTETISLREVRACDSLEDEDAHPDDYETDQSGKPPGKAVMVLQEQKMDKAGWRTLAIRPALYERVEVWNTR